VRPLGFLRQLTTYRARGGSRRERATAPLSFSTLFLRELREAYTGAEAGGTSPDFALDGPDPDAHPPGEWHAVRERPGLQRRIVPYETADGVHLDLHHLSRGGTPSRGPVLLCHGAGGRAQVWYAAPMRRTICDALLDAGYDVWVQNWRGSIEYPPQQYSLDAVAANDHPAAIAKVCEQTGAGRIKAIVQCQGSTSMTIAAIAGLVPEVTHVLSSAVSLHPVVPRLAHLKTAALLPGLRRSTAYLDAQWAIRAPTPLSAAIAGWAKVARHRDCDDPVCHLATYMFGWGGDLLWLHANLTPAVHRFLAREFGYVPVRFFRQIHRSISAGHLVPFEPMRGLPESYVDQAPQTDARFTFATGTENRLFLPASQQRSFEHFERFAPGRHAYLEWPRHSHLDPWLSRTAERDIHPGVLEALER
jgi:hypothetical protein